jgi:hypothetical protein
MTAANLMTNEELAALLSNSEEVQRLLNESESRLRDELSLAAPSGEQTLGSIFKHNERQFVALPGAVNNTVIGRLASRAAHCLEFPHASVFMALLGSASAAVATSYAVQYRSGTALPCGLYTIIEQPPGTSKSWLLNIGMTPYKKAIAEHNRRINAHNGSDDVEKASRLAYAFTNATDATAAALDQSLGGCSEGRFVIASAEQGAFASLFPDGTFHSTNDLALSGYVGEHVSSLRKGRQAFDGTASGTIVLIAQPGSAKRVLSASNGTGLADRFMYMSEATTLGTRQLHGEYLSNAEKADFERACAECVKEYSAKIIAGADAESRVILDPENLTQLKLSADGYAAITNMRRDMERRLGVLSSKGEYVLLGWLAKAEMHALKIAAVLHVIECKAAGCKVPEIIPANHVRAALDLLAVLGKHLEQLLHSSGESGELAEIEAVFDCLSGPAGSVTKAVMKLKNRAPFKAMGKAGYAAARARVTRMIDTGMLMIDTNGALVVI